MTCPTYEIWFCAESVTVRNSLNLRFNHLSPFLFPSEPIALNNDRGNLSPDDHEDQPLIHSCVEHIFQVGTPTNVEPPWIHSWSPLIHKSVYPSRCRMGWSVYLDMDSRKKRRRRGSRVSSRQRDAINPFTRRPRIPPNQSMHTE